MTGDSESRHTITVKFTPRQSALIATLDDAPAGVRALAADGRVKLQMTPFELDELLNVLQNAMLTRGGFNEDWTPTPLGVMVEDAIDRIMGGRESARGMLRTPDAWVLDMIVDDWEELDNIAERLTRGADHPSGIGPGWWALSETPFSVDFLAEILSRMIRWGWVDVAVHDESRTDGVVLPPGTVPENFAVAWFRASNSGRILHRGWVPERYPPEWDTR